MPKIQISTEHLNWLKREAKESSKDTGEVLTPADILRDIIESESNNGMM